MNRHTTTRPRVAQIVPQTKHKAHIETHTTLRAAAARAGGGLFKATPRRVKCK